MQKLRNGRAYHDGYQAFYNRDFFNPWPRGDLRSLKWERGWNDALTVAMYSSQLAK